MTDYDPDEEPGAQPPAIGWRERLWSVGAAAGRVLETRIAIFQEELSAKGMELGKALAGLFVAVLFATLAGLLLTALLAAVLSKLLGGPVLGILATLVLYVAVAAVAGRIAVKKLTLLRPLEFPATRREIDRDLAAVKKAAGVGEPRGPDDGSDGEGTLPGRGRPPEAPEDIEARLREGAG
jgi:uncharacterized membrane protein YqjE